MPMALMAYEDALEEYGGIEDRLLMQQQERWVEENRQSLLAASKP